MVRAAFPDFRYAIEQEIAEGDQVVLRVRARGTQTGPLLGIPATDRQAEWTETHIIRVAEGRAAEHWGNRDDLGMLQQLGVIPPLGGHLEPN
jgi:predicted ester cyclase